MLLGQFLKECRTQAGLSQRDVAKALKYTTSQFVSNWERGISRPPRAAVKALVPMYKMDPELFKLEYRTDMRKEADRNADAIFKGVVK